MWAKNKQNGFTIVETLIVLAVTAAMFLSTSFLVSGQIAKTQYKSGMSEIQTITRDVFNDVQTGYYPNIPTGSGAADYCGGGSETLNTSGVSINCVIAGKKITFTENNLVIDTLAVNAGSASSTNPVSVGNQAAFKPITDLREARPYPASLRFTGSYFPNPLSDKQNETVAMEYNVLYSLYSSSTTGQFTSGAQGIAMYTSDIKAMSTINSGNGRTLCFSDGTRYGSVTIGVRGNLDATVNTDDTQCK